MRKLIQDWDEQEKSAALAALRDPCEHSLTTFIDRCGATFSAVITAEDVFWGEHEEAPSSNAMAKMFAAVVAQLTLDELIANTLTLGSEHIGFVLQHCIERMQDERDGEAKYEIFKSICLAKDCEEEAQACLLYHLSCEMPWGDRRGQHAQLIRDRYWEVLHDVPSAEEAPPTTDSEVEWYDQVPKPTPLRTTDFIRLWQLFMN